MNVRSLRRFGAMALGTALLSTGLAACGGDDASSAEAPTTGDAAWDAIVADAYEEGEVTVYNAASELQNKRLLEAFEEEYPGIDLTIERGASELPGRVEAELGSGTDGADVLMYSDPNWFIANEDKLAELSGPGLEGWNPDWWAVDGKSAVITALPWSIIAWNTEIFPDGFENYEDILDPAVKGKLATRSELTPSVAGYLDFMERELGPEYLEGLADQDPKFYPSSLPLLQAIGSGEVGVTLFGFPAGVKEMQEAGAPIESIEADPGFAFNHAAGAFAEAQSPNAGVVFMSFLMSETGQEAYNGEGLGGGGREGVEGAIDISGYELLDLEKFSDPAKIEEWNEKFTEYFG